MFSILASYITSCFSSRRLLTWLPLALLGLTILILFHRLLFGDVLFWGLPSLQFYPWREFAMREFAQGRWPLWNPYNGAGVPLLANYQSALLYPPHLLYWLWSGPQMMGYLGMLHLAWAGLGMWLLAGRLELSPLGRGLVTLSYPLCTPLVARFGTFPMVDVATWLPWLILTLDRLLDGLTLWRLLALSGVVAMQLLAGHAQWTFYSLILAGGFALWRLAAEHRLNIRAWLPIMAGALAAVCLGVGIAGAQLIPTAELQRESQRATGVDEAFALNFSYAPLSLITWFNPNFFGNPGDGSYAIGGAYFETTAYVGVLPVTLAILGTFHYFLRRKRSAPQPRAYLIPFLALVTLIALVLAFGQFTPLYPLLYRTVPTFNLFQAPARWLLLAVFSVTLSAGFAASTWTPDWQHRGRVRLALAGSVSLFAAGIVVQLLLRNVPPLTLQMARGTTVFGFLLMAVALIFVTQPRDKRRWARWAASILIFVAADLWWANSLSNPTVSASFYDKQTAATPSASRVFWLDPQNQPLPGAAFTTFLPLNDYRAAITQQAEYRRSNLPNLNLLDRQPSLNDFDPLRPDGLERFTRLMNESPRLVYRQAAGVGTMYGAYPETSDAARVWMVPSFVAVTSADAAEQVMRTETWNPYETVVLEVTTASIRFSGSQKAGSAHITAETPLNLAIAVESPEGGILIVADTYYPGWSATLDGSPTTIYRANLAFRAVTVPPGSHIVAMTYQPRSFVLGVVVSTLSLVVCGILVVIALIRQRRGLSSASCW